MILESDAPITTLETTCGDGGGGGGGDGGAGGSVVPPHAVLASRAMAHN
jgi:hypothetical protein